MKNHANIIVLSLLLVVFSLPAVAYDKATDDLLHQLDMVLENPGQWVEMKQLRLHQLHQRENRTHSLKDQYDINQLLFDEYSVFNSDSAANYAVKNSQIASKLDDKEKIILWRIHRSFTLATTGLLKESKDILDSINPEEIPEHLTPLYYNQLAYLYSHFGQYQGRGRTTPSDYYAISRAYRDSTFAHARPSDDLYLWYKAWSSENRTGDNLDQMIKELKQYVDSSSMSTRKDAMMAYVLANLYKISNDKDNQVKYLAKSAICDIETANRDIASLEELGKLMIEENELDRAFSYISFCQEQAQSFNNRVRSLSLSKAEKSIKDYYSRRDAEQKNRLKLFNWCLLGLLCVLIAAIAYSVNRNKRLNDSRLKLAQVNKQLHNNIDELNELREAEKNANSMLKEMNEKLKEMNLKLSEVNTKLNESNHIKEEYVGQMFYLCSFYISKIEDFRKDVLRKLKSGDIAELQKEITIPSMVQTELKEFHKYFDTVFLHMFPDFVKDFNRLLRPEEQIVLGDGELLNTPLRIYALVRLGITDSVKIAALLHCSSQTVYNNRMRVRNKSILPKEEFAEAVRTLGKFQGEG
ncbi:MAG: transcriptional regulator [Bacteroides sp.]|nr:transcriptional regulator [Bacteroides sp.]